MPSLLCLGLCGPSSGSSLASWVRQTAICLCCPTMCTLYIKAGSFPKEGKAE